ncbi:MAG: 50S ribosomal protein L18 [Minisyncoccia bacterium]|jgi:large subunit ribosomal protein L18
MVLVKKQIKKEIRKKRIRAKIRGTNERPRLSVFRSHKHIYAQIINDEKGITLVAASDKEIKEKKLNKSQIAFNVGKLIAEKAKEKNITKVVFDRGAYKYHGRIKQLADGARENGLIF